MDEDLAAHVVDGVTQGQRSQADVTAGIVGDGDGADARVGREVAGLRAQALTSVVLDGARPGDELGEDEAAIGARQGISECGHATDGTHVVDHSDGPSGTVVG